MVQRILTWMKNNYLLLLAGFCLVFTGVILLNIYYWFSTSDNTENLLQTIQYQEVVEVEDVGSSTPEDGIVTADDSTPEGVKRPPYIEVDFTSLKERNPDIVAWLKFDAVGVSIPIVQTTDNEFYLTHDVDKKPSKLGWVFADVRSNMEILGFNTVFYGHNNSNRQMFGALKEIFNVKESEKTTKEIIQLTTPYSKMVFQVVSVYVTNYEDWKYVDQVFTDEQEKQEFIDMIKERNTMPLFDSDISPLDRILTFSTCYGPAGTEDRLVIHAKMVAEEWITP